MPIMPIPNPPGVPGTPPPDGETTIAHVLPPPSDSPRAINDMIDHEMLRVGVLMRTAGDVVWVNRRAIGESLLLRQMAFELGKLLAVVAAIESPEECDPDAEPSEEVSMVAGLHLTRLERLYQRLFPDHLDAYRRDRPRPDVLVADDG